MRRGKNGWLLVFFLILGSFLGSLLGQALGGIAPWLNIASQPYGINPPLVLSLDMFSLTFGFSVRLTVAGVLGLILAFLLYKRI